jgi:hypothetical protein
MHAKRVLQRPRIKTYREILTAITKNHCLIQRLFRAIIGIQKKEILIRSVTKPLTLNPESSPAPSA